jgi:hypothetical protein
MLQSLLMALSHDVLWFITILYTRILMIGLLLSQPSERLMSTHEAVAYSLEMIRLTTSCFYSPLDPSPEQEYYWWGGLQMDHCPLHRSLGVPRLPVGVDLICAHARGDHWACQDLRLSLFVDVSLSHRYTLAAGLLWDMELFHQYFIHWWLRVDFDSLRDIAVDWVADLPSYLWRVHGLTCWFSPSLQRTYEIYHHLRRGHPGVSFRHWIAYFIDRVHTRSEGLASTRDPFGTGMLEIHHDGPIPSQDTLCSHDVDRETYLIAFISWWICYFMLPNSPVYTIWPSMFVMASLIAHGDRISLVVPVLANIYRALHVLTSSRSPSHCQELIIWHLISGWLHMHWSGSYDPRMAITLRDHLPLLSDLAGVQPALLTSEAARYRFFRSRYHLRFSRDRLAVIKVARAANRVVIDSEVSSSDPSSIRAKPTDLEYLISIHQDFFPLILGSYLFIEPYSPHRCAHHLFRLISVIHLRTRLI